MRILLPLVIAFSVLGCPKAPPKGTGGTTTVKSAPPFDAQVHKLDNGLTVYIDTTRQEPRISAWIAVRSGSRNDPADSTGLAHYLEHMLFKGTARLGTIDFEKEQPLLKEIEGLYGKLAGETTPTKRSEILKAIDSANTRASNYAVPNEFDQLYAELGISGVNAFTGEDMTVYIADVPTNRFGTWARLEADRFINPQFRMFLPELEAVYEEKNRSLDNPLDRVFESMGLALFPKHPYGTQPTIGHTEHLKSPDYASMKTYFDNWYVPNNVAIILSGDIDAETALPVLERTFGGWKSKPLPAQSPAQMDPLEGRIDREILAKGENAVFLGWPTVAARHSDEVALEVLDYLVGNEKAGLISLDLLLPQAVPDAGSYNMAMVEGGAWLIYATARQGQSHRDVEALLNGVIGKLKSGSFSEEDVAAAIVNMEIDLKRSLESRDRRVSMMSDAFIRAQPWKEVGERLDRLSKIRRADIVRVANAYLTDKHVVVKRRRGDYEPPRITKPTITPVKIDSTRESAFAKQVRAEAVTPIAPKWLVEGTDYQRGRLPAGDIIAVANTTNDLFSVSYDFDLGHVQQPLLCQALSLFDQAGTPTMDAATRKQRLYQMGTTVSHSCDDDSTTIRVSGIDRNFEESLGLLREWIAAPVISDELAEKSARNALSVRQDNLEEPRFAARVLAEFASYGDKSSFLKVASNQQLEDATARDHAALIVGLSHLAHRTSYFGPRALAGARDVIALGSNHKKVPVRAPYRYRKVTEATVYVIDRKVNQSTIRLIFPWHVLSVPDRALSYLYSEYVGGGMGGLIFQEIREARGLAYSAWGDHSFGPRKDDQSAIIGGLGTQTDKTVEAVTQMLRLLPTPTIEPSRFKTAKRSLEQQYRSDRVQPREIGDRVQSWDEAGFERDPRPAEWNALESLGPPALSAFVERFSDIKPIISITTNSERVQWKDLERFGRIIETKIGELISY